MCVYLFQCEQQSISIHAHTYARERLDGDVAWHFLLSCHSHVLFFQYIICGFVRAQTANPWPKNYLLYLFFFYFSQNNLLILLLLYTHSLTHWRLSHSENAGDFSKLLQLRQKSLISFGRGDYFVAGIISECANGSQKNI